MRRRRAAMLTLLPLAGLVAVPVELTWREVRQEQLNHALISAVIQNRASRVRSFLQQGASPNAFLAYDDRSIWRRLLDTVLHRPRGRRRNQRTSTECQVVTRSVWRCSLEPSLMWAVELDGSGGRQGRTEAASPSGCRRRA